MSPARSGFVTGSRFEASALPSNFPVLCTGLRAAAARPDIKDFAAGRITALVSFGFAGGLDPKLRAGALVIADAVVTESGAARRTDPALTAQLVNVLPHAIVGPVCVCDQPVTMPIEKQSLLARTGALAVEMEGQVVADVAGELGLPFAVLRAVSDAAQAKLPEFVISSLRCDGSVATSRLLLSLIRRPGQLPDFAALIHSTTQARSVLRAAAHDLRTAPTFV